MDMEVDNVQESSCDSKSQQQQLVQANKANSLAMEVTWCLFLAPQLLPLQQWGLC